MARQYHRMRGAVLLVSSCLLFSTAGCLVRAGAHIGPLRMVMFRFAIGLVIIAAVVVSGRARLRLNDKRLLFLRGLTGGIATFIAFTAITKLGLGIRIRSLRAFSALYS